MTKLVANSDVKIDKAVRMYVSKVEKEADLSLVDKDITYKKFLSNRMLIVHSIRRGLPYEIYDLIKERTPFNEEDWAQFLGVSLRTLQRNKSKKDFVFDPIPTEKILELAEVTALGKEVFDSMIQTYILFVEEILGLEEEKPDDLNASQRCGGT